MWAPGHCGLPGSELADHQAKLVAAETQPDNALGPATRRALIHHSYRSPPIQLEQLKEVYTSLPDEQIKTELTDLACFCSGYHPALRRWQRLVGISVDAVCWLCGEEVESAEHLWLWCPSLLVEQRHSDLPHTMDELVRHSLTGLALLRIILRQKQQLLQWFRSAAPVVKCLEDRVLLITASTPQKFFGGWSQSSRVAGWWICGQTVGTVVFDQRLFDVLRTRPTPLVVNVFEVGLLMLLLLFLPPLVILTLLLLLHRTLTGDAFTVVICDREAFSFS